MESGISTTASVKTLLNVKNLCVRFPSRNGDVRAVDGVTFSLTQGRTLGIVGESGCGKSVSALAILRLIRPPGVISNGEIWYRSPTDGEPGKMHDLLRMSEPEIRRVRGAGVAMIFQEPMTALNPVFTIGNQIREAIQAHERISRREAECRTEEVMHSVAIPSPRQRMKEFPHQLSGGLRQRAMIAMALAPRPNLLIADEPTTALDVTIQAQILRLLQELKERRNLSLIVISHDLGVIAEIADEVVVMYAGKIVECGSTHDVLRDPLHPYTAGLVKSVPMLTRKADRGARMQSIPGLVPSMSQLPSGCAFQPRCKDELGEKCAASPVELLEWGESRQVRCVKYLR